MPDRIGPPPVSPAAALLHAGPRKRFPQATLMENRLYIIVKNPFTKRDFERFGIETLQRHFTVRILDCTAWVMPKALVTRAGEAMTLPAVRTIGSLRQFKDELGDASGGIAIDGVGQFSLKAILLFHALKARGVKLLVWDSGAYPEPTVIEGTRSFAVKLVDAIRSNRVPLHVNALIGKLLLKCLPDQTPDYALVSGTSWLDNPRFSRAAEKIQAHSMDYETYWQLRRLPEYRRDDYAVYLDEDIADHEDNVEIGLKTPVSAHHFFGALSKFFDGFESASGIPVLIAGYPTERAGRSVHFDGRELIQGETAQLVRNARVVFAHASTAVSYAVLWRRPVVFLTSDEMIASWYHSWIEAPRAILKSPIVNIDDAPDWSRVGEWQDIDQGAYRTYEATYIKSPSSPDKSLWEIVVEAFSEHFGTSQHPT